MLDALPVDIQQHIEVRWRCWIWTGSRHGSGYGRMTLPGGRHWLAHRLVYTILVGDPGENLHHRFECDKACVNPDHLQPLTLAEHQREHFVRAECFKGHPMDDAYLVHKSDGRILRHCRRCQIDRQSRYYREQKAAGTLAPRKPRPRKDPSERIVKVFCKNGHRFDGRAGKQQICSTCRRDADARYQDRLRGDKPKQRRLTQEEKAEIFNKRETGAMIKDLATEYGVSKPTIRKAVDDTHKLRMNA